MNLKDIIIIGSVAICSLFGIIQHSLANNKDKPEEVTAKISAPTDASTTENSYLIEEPAAIHKHTVKTRRARNYTQSYNDRRRAAIQKQRSAEKETQKEYESSDIDYFAAREGLKKELFSASFNGGNNNLSDEEKWKLIESGSLPR